MLANCPHSPFSARRYVILLNFHHSDDSRILNFTLRFALIKFLSLRIIIDHPRLYFRAHHLRVWLKYYHEERPHRGIGRDNSVLDETFVPQTEGRVRCKTELGGILKSYYREAA